MNSPAHQLSEPCVSFLIIQSSSWATFHQRVQQCWPSYTYNVIASEVSISKRRSRPFQCHPPGHFAPETKWGMDIWLWAVAEQSLIDFLGITITSKDSPSRVDSTNYETLSQVTSCWEGSHPWKPLVLLLEKNILLVVFSSKKWPLFPHPCRWQHHKYLEFG